MDNHDFSCRPDPAALTVYFDGDCPLCSVEIAHYRACDRAGALAFVDAAGNAAMLPPDLKQADALARFHVRQTDGRLVSGAAAFVAVWRVLPRWRWLARIASLPGVTTMLEAGYRLILPWRPRLAALLVRRSNRPARTP